MRGGFHPCFKKTGLSTYFLVKEGNGSRVRVELNGFIAVFHRPHPEKEASKSRVRAAREFLEKAGVRVEDNEI